MLQFVPLVVIGFLVAYGFTPVTRQIALRWNVVDQPNHRKIHVEPMPMLGGLAILVAFLFATLAVFALATSVFQVEEFFIEFIGVVIGCVWLAGVGLWDDRYGMRPLVKLGAQMCAGLLMIGVGIQIQIFNLPLLDYALTLFWMVGIINAINFMDNMDGLAAGVSAIAAGTFFILAASQELILVASLSGALCGATLGFLRYNFNPASTFMGDTGSLVLGFLLAMLGIKLQFPAQTIQVTWIIPVLVLFVPIFDTSLVTFTRLREGRSPFLGGKDHVSHRLVRAGLSQPRAVLTLYSVAALCGVLAIYLSQATPAEALVLMFVFGSVALTAFGWLEYAYTRFS